MCICDHTHQVQKTAKSKSFTSFWEILLATEKCIYSAIFLATYLSSNIFKFTDETFKKNLENMILWNKYWKDQPMYESLKPKFFRTTAGIQPEQMSYQDYNQLWPSWPSWKFKPYCTISQSFNRRKKLQNHMNHQDQTSQKKRFQLITVYALSGKEDKISGPLNKWKTADLNLLTTILITIM